MATALTAASHASAQAYYSQFCPEADICYRLNIPTETAFTGKGDIYIQISSLVTYEWVALGLGHQMAGSKVFIMYADGMGNVTVSPRLGRGHYEPRYDSGADFEVLDGTGVDGYRMTANIRCGDCTSWVGGGMNFMETSGLWVYAARPGLPLDSSDPNENLKEHRQHGVFDFSYLPAKGGQNLNPFLLAPPADVPLGIQRGLPSVPLHWNPSDAFPVAHGTIASFAILVLFPLGAILIRVTSERRLVWVHAGIQILAYVMLFVAMGMGIRIASSGQLFHNYHPFIGIFMVVVIFFQVCDGLLHHSQWLQNKKRRTRLAYVHIWMGRALIVIGMINGGFGLQLAGVASPAKKAGYGVVAGASFVSMVVAICYGERKRALALKAKREEKENREMRLQTSRFE
ncbi:uncharacterized protein LTR77_010504 [Saxophila tyrrhenica]|uniref:Cytochrome b561 domain-containing protein n=1 Tax=Saxophila tyrrhenica TaxID=1690608 RepID=A0AAV9NUZ2_9PEZI|nr:hypothetical protein LTR77_010504 [Saxophila tyrrhenica]